MSGEQQRNKWDGAMAAQGQRNRFCGGFNEKASGDQNAITMTWVNMLRSKRVMHSGEKKTTGLCICTARTHKPGCFRTLTWSVVSWVRYSTLNLCGSGRRQGLENSRGNSVKHLTRACRRNTRNARLSKTPKWEPHCTERGLRRNVASFRNTHSETHAFVIDTSREVRHGLIPLCPLCYAYYKARPFVRKIDR